MDAAVDTVVDRDVVDSEEEADERDELDGFEELNVLEVLIVLVDWDQLEEPLDMLEVFEEDEKDEELEVGVGVGVRLEEPEALPELDEVVETDAGRVETELVRLSELAAVLLAKIGKEELVLPVMMAVVFA